MQRRLLGAFDPIERIWATVSSSRAGIMLPEEIEVSDEETLASEEETELSEEESEVSEVSEEESDVNDGTEDDQE